MGAVGKGIKLGLLILLVAGTFLGTSTPAFGQTVSGEGSYGSQPVYLSFSGHVSATAGSCQQVYPPGTMNCQVPAGAQCVISLTATKSGAWLYLPVTITALSLPAGWPATANPMASGQSPVTAT